MTSARAALVFLFLLASSAHAQPAEPVMVKEIATGGALRVEPDTGVAGERGTWTVLHTVGPEGIATGGGIRVELPDPWHSGPRNSALRLQATDPSGDYYVASHASREGVRLATYVEYQENAELAKNPRPSLDGRFERFVYVVRVVVEEGELRAGDILRVVYGETGGGSPGYRASSVTTGPMPVMMAVDSDGSSRFKLHAARPTMRVLPGKPVEMQFHAPSIVAEGETLNLLVSLVDGESNPTDVPASISLSVLTGTADLPEHVAIPRGKGYVEFQGKATGSGVLRLKAAAAEWGLTAKANPVDVRTEPVGRRIYWGDTHSHTHYSWDGVGDDAFDYGRYTSGLDFYAMTDHAMLPDEEGTRGLHEDQWEEYVAEVEAHHAPHRFVTIPAYECSFGPPYGHHNVYFRDHPGPLVYNKTSTLPELWKLLKAGHALTIPHHTGKFPRGVEFSVQNDELRRNFEIYSAHGLSEAYNPEHPLAFEQSDFTSASTSVQAPTFAQDVWIKGYAFSTIASSDDHRAHPGQPHYGLAAVQAVELTRDAVFQALYDRHTYGTTGAKIILEFALDGAPMGQRVRTTGAPELAIRVVGTDTIAWVELLRWQPGTEAFQVLERWEPDADECAVSWRDETDVPGAIYYVRVKQAELVRNRVAMAWSSPIWTQP